MSHVAWQVAMVGSGAWACAAVRMLAQSAAQEDPADEFEDEIRMWYWVRHTGEPSSTSQYTRYRIVVQILGHSSVLPCIGR